MAIKRFLLLSFTLIVSLTCVGVMNIHYDVLSRYTYEISEEDADKLRNNLTYKEINYLIDYSINSNLFIKFVDKEGFNVYHFPFYNRIDELVGDYYSPDNIVYYAERALKADINEDDFINYLGMGYQVDTIVKFYEDSGILKKDTLAIDPLNYNYKFKDNETVYTLQPYDLVIVDYLPNSSIAELRSVISANLLKLLNAVNEETNFNVFENVDITRGFVSYDTINTKRKQGDKTLAAGKNYYQLGRMFTLSCNERYSSAFFEIFNELCGDYGFTISDKDNFEYLYNGN